MMHDGILDSGMAMDTATMETPTATHSGTPLAAPMMTPTVTPMANPMATPIETCMETLNDGFHIEDAFEEECDLLTDGVMLAPLEGQSISDQNIKKCTSAKLFSDLDRQMILADITSEPKSISSVAKANKVNPTTIHYWAKQFGKELPVYQSKRDIVQKCDSGEASPATLAKISGRATGCGS